MHTQPPLTDLAALAGKQWPDCPCGRSHGVPTREMIVETGGLARLPEVMDRWIGPGRVLMVVDSNTWEACGSRVPNMVGDENRLTTYFAGHGPEPVHADGETVESLCARVREDNPAGLVAVGAGTINDICKASAAAAGLPLVTVATAASMNGYTSGISALTRDGLKVTEPCRPPLAVIADTEVLAAAPGRMTAAGFGDLLSKTAATADWMLSHVLLDAYFCPLPVQVVEEAIDACVRKAEGIRNQRREGLLALAEALLRSGISMVLAGSSSPASGAEHLISHLWDMTAHWTGRTPALHGEQTGVTTLVSLALYERLLGLEEKDVLGMEPGQAFGSRTAMDAELREVFRELAPSVLAQARLKYLDEPELAARKALIASRWDRIRGALKPMLVSTRRFRDRLESAGAVVRIADLGISRKELEWAYRYARWIRNRYTVLDLAADLGVLEPWMGDVLSEAGVG